MSEFQDAIAELTKIAEKHDSYAYRFYRVDAFPEFDEFDSDLVEVRCWPGNRRHELTPCDEAGRPVEQAKPDYPDDQPFIQAGAVSQPTPTIREEIREEEQEKLAPKLEELEGVAEDVEETLDKAEKKLPWYKRGTRMK